MPYADVIRAFQRWNLYHHQIDMEGFLNFIGTRSFNKLGDRCLLSKAQVERVEVLLSPHWHALLTVHMIREHDE